MAICKTPVDQSFNDFWNVKDIHGEVRERFASSYLDSQVNACMLKNFTFGTEDQNKHLSIDTAYCTEKNLAICDVINFEKITD